MNIEIASKILHKLEQIKYNCKSYFNNYGDNTSFDSANDSLDKLQPTLHAIDEIRNEIRVETSKDVIKEGYRITNRFKRACSAEEISQIKPDIEKFSHFTDEIFGELNEFSEGEKECELSFYLYLALKEKNDYLKLCLEQRGDDLSIEQFKSYLESKDWLEPTYQNEYDDIF